jgi:branched-chain amino acid transport system permease protein
MAAAGALQILNGLTFAGLLFLLASGFTLIFGLLRIMNLTHGGLYLVGGYVAVSVLAITGSFVAALAAAGLAAALLGVGIERGLLRRVRGQVNAEVILTMGLALMIGDLSLAVWGGDSQVIRPPALVAGSVNLAGVSYPAFRLLILLIAVLVGACLWYLQEHTHIGAIIRAGIDDREMLDALGIDVYSVFTVLFVLGAFLAGVAGVLGGVFLGLYPGADFEILLFALVVVIIGGPGSLLGAAVGSLAVGLIDSFAKVVAPELVYFTVFAPMALVLMLRPQGLFGRQP